MDRISKDLDDGNMIEMPNGICLCMIDMMAKDDDAATVRNAIIRAAELGYKAALEKAE